jgi:adenine/guanine phosphoribosyltransferase-like PRPP-binding protein
MRITSNLRGNLDALGVDSAERITLPNGYKFVCLPFGERGLHVESEQISTIVAALVSAIREEGHHWEGIITTSPGGVPWALSVGNDAKLSVSVVRDNYPPEAGRLQDTCDSCVGNRLLTFPTLGCSGRYVFIDDVLSSGRTALAIRNFLDKRKVKIGLWLWIFGRGRNYYGSLDDFPDDEKLHCLYWWDESTGSDFR